MTAETANAADLGTPTASWLRARGYSAKRVARVVDASEGTGKRLRSGFPPTPEQMVKLANHFGWAFVQFIFTQVIGPQTADAVTDIERRLARLEATYAAERQSLVQDHPALARLVPPRPPAAPGETGDPQS